MKKIYVISLILLISISHFAYYFVCSYQQKKIRKEMKMSMRQNLSDFSLVVFEKSMIDREIIWKEKGREFIFHGEMYDIVSITKIAGKTYFHCINDRLEKKLLNDFANKISNQSSGNEKEKKSACQLKFQLQDFILTDYKEPTFFYTSFSHAYYKYDEMPLNTNKKVKLPPPRA